MTLFISNTSSPILLMCGPLLLITFSRFQVPSMTAVGSDKELCCSTPSGRRGRDIGGGLVEPQWTRPRQRGRCRQDGCHGRLASFSTFLSTANRPSSDNPRLSSTFSVPVCVRASPRLCSCGGASPLSIPQPAQQVPRMAPGPRRYLYPRSAWRIARPHERDDEAREHGQQRRTART